MSDQSDKGPAGNGAARDGRDERLAKALRENLKRRKAAQRRQAGSGDERKS